MVVLHLRRSVFWQKAGDDANCSKLISICAFLNNEDIPTHKTAVAAHVRPHR